MVPLAMGKGRDHVLAEGRKEGRKGCVVPLAMGKGRDHVLAEGRKEGGGWTRLRYITITIILLFILNVRDLRYPRK